MGVLLLEVGQLDGGRLLQDATLQSLGGAVAQVFLQGRHREPDDATGHHGCRQQGEGPDGRRAGTPHGGADPVDQSPEGPEPRGGQHALDRHPDGQRHCRPRLLVPEGNKEAQAALQRAGVPEPGDAGDLLSHT